MSEKYKIELSIKAKNDLKSITMYIKDKLQEPNIARNYVRQIKEEIKTLEYSPQKFSAIDMELKNFPIIRKLIIKNHIAFYIINEKEKVVSIDRILYGASNWKDKI
jgi:toxin ParE1/3/4